MTRATLAAWLIILFAIFHLSGSTSHSPSQVSGSEVSDVADT